MRVTHCLFPSPLVSLSLSFSSLLTQSNDISLVDIWLNYSISLLLYTSQLAHFSLLSICTVDRVSCVYLSVCVCVFPSHCKQHESLVKRITLGQFHLMRNHETYLTLVSLTLYFASSSYFPSLLLPLPVFSFPRLPKIKEWIDANDPGALLIPMSGVLESRLADMPEDEMQAELAKLAITRYAITTLHFLLLLLLLLLLSFTSLSLSLSLFTINYSTSCILFAHFNLYKCERTDRARGKNSFEFNSHVPSSCDTASVFSPLSLFLIHL